MTLHTLCLTESSFLWSSWLIEEKNMNKSGAVLEEEEGKKMFGSNQ